MAEVLREITIGEAILRVMRGDITTSDTDAIVNAANSHLSHGGGVAAAICRAGGPQIQRESDEIAFVPEGQVATTGAGTLAADYVIHAVGPRGGDPEGDGKLTACVTNALDEANRLGISSIAFPAVSSGIFGFPKDRCAQILLMTTHDWLTANPASSVRNVDMINIDALTTSVFAAAFDTIFATRL